VEFTFVYGVIKCSIVGYILINKIRVRHAGIENANKK
jgi:hypothetical protein